MLAEIQQVKLRRATTLDKSKPCLRNAQEQEWQAEKNECYYLDLGMDQWLPFVRDLTFKTTSLPLTMADAEILRACYRCLHEGTEKPAALPPTLLESLEGLGGRLQLALETYRDGGAFCKLSGRSSKDAPLHTSKLVDAYTSLVRSSNAQTDNERLCCLFDSALGLMRCRSVAHCLWLLINSQRVDEDLMVAARHPKRWEQSVILREWWDGVTTDLEFRMFIVDGEPTGLTQYNHLVHSPRLVAHHERLANACAAFFEEQVRPRLAGSEFDQKTGGRYVVDLAVHPDALLGEGSIAVDSIKLIELNCFYEATGMGLFDYDRDKEALSHGPMEVRVRETPLPHAPVKLENEWRGVMRGEGGSSHKTDASWCQLDAAEVATFPSRK